jgi:hypothetical protein
MGNCLRTAFVVWIATVAAAVVAAAEPGLDRLWAEALAIEKRIEPAPGGGRLMP